MPFATEASNWAVCLSFTNEEIIMFKKLLLNAAGLVATLAIGTSLAFAAPYLSPSGPNSAQWLEDQDAEILLDKDGNLITIGLTTVIQVGDLFGGIFSIQATQNVNPATTNINLQGSVETFTAIFLIEAETVACKGFSPITGLACSTTAIDGATDTLNFGAATQTQWDSVFGLGGQLDVSSAFDVSDLDGLGANLATGTMSLLFNGRPFEDAILSDGPPNTLSFSDSATTFVDTGAVLQYEFGFTGAGGDAAANEFWTTIGTDAAFPALTGTNNPTNRLALNITQQWAGPELDPHNYLGNIAFDLNFTGDTTLQGKGDFAGGPVGPWTITTDTDLYIRPIPEPAIIALMSLGLLVLGFANRRRKTA